VPVLVGAAEHDDPPGTEQRRGQHAGQADGAVTDDRDDRGLNEIMNNPVLGDERVQEVRDRIAPIITELVAKAKQQGVVRPDFDQTDLIFMQLGLSAIIESTRDIAPELYRRYLTMFLDGIRTDRTAFTPLPTPALTAEQTHRVMTRKRRRTG